MTSKKEQFYIQRIAELEKQVAELTELVKKLTDKVAKLSKNSSNSSKPPSSDITKPPRKKKNSGSRNIGGQPGHSKDDNQVRLQLFCMAYNIGNFLRRLALPKSINDWSLRTMREKLVKIGAKVVSHARYVTFQMAEVLVSRSLFYEILEKIKRLKPVLTG